MQKKNSIIKVTLFILPFILGVVGIAGIEKEPLLDAMYRCIQMYVLGFEGDTSNLLIELARWTAPLATASGIILAVTRIGQILHERIKFFYKDTVAVYADESTGNALLAQLKGRGIAGSDRFVKAHRYILLNDENWNTAFYMEHQQALRDRMVYMRCSSCKAQSSANANLKLFSAEENAARLFWKQQDLYKLSAAKAHKLNIVFIGFGKLGEELLTWGLQNLLFSPSQLITYHIFGNGDAFTALHPSLGKIEDRIQFYTSPWHAHLTTIEQADIVVVIQQEAQSALLSDMLSVLHRGDIDVFSNDDPMINMLEEKERLHIFDWRKAALNAENILDETLLKRAKQINLRYAHLYDNISETPENMEREWKKIGSFTRYSNISAADYHEVRLNMLRVMGFEQDVNKLHGDTLELLSELEHMRWCMYHYLNNWNFGIPADGERKDAKLRIHTALIPYGDLSDAEKDKDRENIRVLLSIKP